MQETCCRSCSEDVKANFLTDSIYSQSYTHHLREPSGFTGSKSSPYRRIANTDCGIEHAVTSGCHRRSSCVNCHLSRCVTEMDCLIIYVHPEPKWSSQYLHTHQSLPHSLDVLTSLSVVRKRWLISNYVRIWLHKPAPPVLSSPLNGFWYRANLLKIAYHGRVQLASD